MTPPAVGAPPRRFAQFRDAALRLRSGQDRRSARAEVDALLRAGVLHEVDLEWDDHADCSVECLRRTVSETAVRLDAVALCYHREVIEALRWGVTRMVEAIESWPGGGADGTATDALDHAASLRVEMDAAVARIDREVFAAIGKGRGIAVLVTDGPWTADEAVVTPALRDAAARWRGWWLDWFQEHERKIAAG